MVAHLKKACALFCPLAGPLEERLLPALARFMGVGGHAVLHAELSALCVLEVGCNGLQL